MRLSISASLLLDLWAPALAVGADCPPLGHIASFNADPPATADYDFHDYPGGKCEPVRVKGRGCRPDGPSKKLWAGKAVTANGRDARLDYQVHSAEAWLAQPHSPTNVN